MLMLHRRLGTWQHKVNRYIALNEFCRVKFIEAGLPADRVVVKPNFVDAPPPVESPRADFLFVGRLSLEKGLEVLAKAWGQYSGTAGLRVAGTGPEITKLVGLPRVEVLGQLASVQVQACMAQSTALVLPSICYENFPVTLVEAMAAGLPIIASRIGALAALIRHGQTGLLFEPGDAADLARTMAWAAEHPQEMARMGREARQDYEAHYTPQRNLAMLLAIYADACAAQSDVRHQLL
jgi:glycosyltransferase involved in cell wall biosynthesis